MSYIPVKALVDGDRLGQHVYSSDGRLALAKGIVLTSKLIEGLYKIGINEVDIDNRRDNEIDVKDTANDGDYGYIRSLRENAHEVMKSVFSEVALKGTFNSGPVTRLANEIARRFGNDLESSVQMKELREPDSYLLSHSINVCLLAVLTAHKLNYSEEHLRTVAIGALLHDIGYVSPDAANPALDHPKVGFDLLRRNHDIPLLSAHIALQHHEQINGAGFPLGIRGEAFRQSAQIVAISNDFDHFINEIGMNRLPHEGIEYVMSKVDTSYDIEVVRAFIKCITPYPVGTVVKLSNGMTGRVCAVDENYPTRPVVVMRDGDMRIDLMKMNSIMIKEVVLNDETARCKEIDRQPVLSGVL
ncbi:HD domain-containing protein [Paenibacillus oenotherae]|uniref:HD domain-containing protein n=1 Tax=Paenibacillus oenotherae TaxID=1435645 RepID=A0ABS7D4Q4_9BACL|nr:HD domain-containing protein [Paenibacillus oenotherae]MBW7474870.1 HD domain-containing protein [Paenibacillus oenotherae]